MHTIPELTAALDALSVADAAAFGIEHQTANFTGTVRRETAWLADYNSFSFDNAEATLIWLGNLWNRADAICTVMGNSPLGYTARDIRAMIGDIRENIQDMRNGFKRNDTTMTRDAYALLTTGLLADGTEV